MPTPILLVDDDDDSRELLSALLRDHGHDVYVARHGKEALSMLPSLPPRCTVLLDLNMPEMGGEQLLGALNAAALPDAYPVILISADDRPLETEYRNVLARFSKPFEFAELTRTLARADRTESHRG
jgi:twitching motility two-component system response regulator PilH